MHMRKMDIIIMRRMILLITPKKTTLHLKTDDQSRQS